MLIHILLFHVKSPVVAREKYVNQTNTFFNNIVLIDFSTIHYYWLRQLFCLLETVLGRL